MYGLLVHSLLVFFFIIFIPYLSSRWARESARVIFSVIVVFAGFVFLIFTGSHVLLQGMDLLDAVIRGIGQALILACLFFLSMKVKLNEQKGE